MRKKTLIILFVVIFISICSIFYMFKITNEKIDNNIISAYCSGVDASINNRKTILKNGESKLLNLDHACHARSLSQSSNYIFFDSGLNLSVINKKDYSIKKFEYINRDTNIIEMSSAQNLISSKLIDKQSDTYISTFAISPTDSVIKIFSNGEYKQNYVELSELRIFKSDSKLNVIGFSDEYQTLKHYTYDIVDNILKNEKLINSYKIDQNIDLFPSSFFYYNGILSTISSTQDSCKLQLFQFDKEIKISDLDKIYDCDNSTFSTVGDMYENSYIDGDNIVLDFIINENNYGIKDLVNYKINIKDLSFKKISTQNLSQNIGYFQNVATNYINDKYYFAVNESLFETSIYELNDNGSINLIQSDIGFNGNKSIKSFLVLDTNTDK